MKTHSANQNAKIKKVGPIRTGALIPSFILILLIGGYFHLFFDGHLRRLIEWTGTQIHGAEVNVGYVKTSFFKGSFETGHIEVTDKEQPQRNLVVIGKIHFQFLWDALLRAKFVIEDASLLNIQALSPRKHPGRVLPPPPPEKKEGPGLVSQLQDTVLEQAESQFNKNILGDLAHLLDGVDPQDQFKKMQNELKSSEKIKILEQELKEKEKLWKARLKSLPQKEQIESLSQRIKALKFNSKNPAEFAQSLKEAGAILKESEQTLRLVTETGHQLNSDVDTYAKSFKELEKMAQDDLNDLKNRLKIPDIKADDFTKSLFLRAFSKKLGSLFKYVSLAQQYMPPKKDAKGATVKKDQDKNQASEFLPPRRGQGRNYKFPVAQGYPLFWLKHAAISSTAVPELEYSGHIRGELKNFSTDPHLLGLPAILTATGDFPKPQVMGLNLRAVFDHTTNSPRESLDFKVARYPVSPQTLTEGPDVTFKIQDAIGGLDLKASFSEGLLEVKMLNSFSKIQYDIAAKNKILKEILTKTMAGIPMIGVQAQAHGPWSHLNLSLSSNLGDELSQGFRQQIQAKLDETTAQLKTLINSAIGERKDKLNGDFNKIKGEISGEVQQTQNEIEKTKKEAQKSSNPTKSGGGLKNLEEQGKKVLKQFKFGR